MAGSHIKILGSPNHPIKKLRQTATQVNQTQPPQGPSIVPCPGAVHLPEDDPALADDAVRGARDPICRGAPPAGRVARRERVHGTNAWRERRQGAVGQKRLTDCVGFETSGRLLGTSGGAKSQTLHGTGIFTYIGVVLGVNVGKYASPMECLAKIVHFGQGMVSRHLFLKKPLRLSRAARLGRAFFSGLGVAVALPPPASGSEGAASWGVS